MEKVIAAREKYPSVKIMLYQQTGSRGRDSYNLSLIQKRAESIVNYMMAKEKVADNLKSEGFGEIKLCNRGKNGVRCSAKEQELNRISDFIILE